VSAKYFLDSNILICGDDLDAGKKNEKALKVIEESVASGNGVISTQVLQEYFVNATKKLGVLPEVAQRKVTLFSAMNVVRIAVEDIHAAIDLNRLHQLALWDAMIIRCAAVAGCDRVLTEDLQHGQVIAGVKIENPFLTFK